VELGGSDSDGGCVLSGGGTAARKDSHALVSGETVCDLLDLGDTFAGGGTAARKASHPLVSGETVCDLDLGDTFAGGGTAARKASHPLVSGETVCDLDDLGDSDREGWPDIAHALAAEHVVLSLGLSRLAR
jgi:hypothetical protein